jgi:hypothetical protein
VFCPVNLKLNSQPAIGATFSSDETSLLITCLAKEKLPEKTARKLEASGFNEDEIQLVRNLKIMLASPENVALGLKLVHNRQRPNDRTLGEVK